MAKKNAKIRFTGAAAVKCVDPYVQMVLTAIASHFESSWIALASVSAESKVWDFMPESYFNQDRKTDLMIDLELRLAQETNESRIKILNQRIERVGKIPDRLLALTRLASVSSELDVDVSVDDHIYEIAARLRNKVEP